MQIKLINVPLTDDGAMQGELNKFLAGHKVLEVEQKFFQNEKGGCWSFCIRYIETAASSQASQFTGKEKIDYKQVLSEQEFAVFSKLRECSKVIAAEDAVPAYAVFTDEELAGIARLPEIETVKLINIKGIGDKKVEKYGKKIAAMYKQKSQSTDETGIQPD